MAENLKPTGRRSPDPETLERWLWAYASGVLEPNQEKFILEHIAQNPAAFSRLEEIRAHFQSVAERRAPSLAQARANAAPWSVQLGRMVDSIKQRWMERLSNSVQEMQAGLLAVVVRRGENLHALAQRAGVACAAVASPGMLSSANKSAASATQSGPESGAPHQHIIAPDGTTITLSLVGDQEVDILLELPNRQASGIAELTLLSSPDGTALRQKLAVAPLEQGIAQFPRSPLGLLELRGDGFGPFLIGVAPSPEPSASSSS